MIISAAEKASKKTQHSLMTEMFTIVQTGNNSNAHLQGST
jgi:hypothetical protein